jgi:hypothetical protein
MKFETWDLKRRNERGRKKDRGRRSEHRGRAERRKIQRLEEE